jgi:hypothetical protein
VSKCKDELTVGWKDENGHDFGKLVGESEIYLLPKQRRSFCGFLNARNIIIFLFVYSALDIYFEAIKVFQILVFSIFHKYLN